MEPALPPPTSPRRMRGLFVALALTGAVLLAGLAYAGYRQPELVFQLAGFRLC